MDPATLYMLANCSGGSLCLPLAPYGYTMTKAECEAKALEIRLAKPIVVGCLDEHGWVFISKNTAAPERPLPAIAR